MLKILATFFSASLLMLSMSQGQMSASRLEKRCQDILSGTQRTHLKNEILKKKDLLYSSDLVSTYCPNLKNMESDDEKAEAVVRLMAAYSYAEMNCNPKLQSPPLSQRRMPRLGGYYNLPLDYKDRKAAPLAGTPCDVLELTPVNQAACAIYLAQIPESQDS